MIDYVLVWVMGIMLKGMGFVCSVWANMKEHQTMKNRGFTLMTDEHGNDFWVGYED